MGEGHLGVDQLLNLVLGVALVLILAVLALVPALPIPVVVVAVLKRAMRRLDIGEREDGLAACPPAADRSRDTRLPSAPFSRVQVSAREVYSWLRR
jgi:hypothetical protein